MRAYDKLPMMVRMALSVAIEDYACVPILTQYRRGKPVHSIVTMIAEWNADARAGHWYRYDRLARDGTSFFNTIRRRKPRD